MWFDVQQASAKLAGGDMPLETFPPATTATTATATTRKSLSGPTLDAVKGLRRTVLPRCIAPPQPVAIYEDYPAQNPPSIHAWLAMALRKERPQPLHLLVRQPEKIAHHYPLQFGSLNHAVREASRRSMGPDPSLT
jgi:hypothetical protein